MEPYHLTGWDPDLKRDVELQFEGQQLAKASSQRDTHNEYAVHEEGTALQFERCSACRWFEVELYRTDDPEQRWVAYTIGRSLVPGEQSRYRLRATSDPRRVVSFLTVADRDSGVVRIPSVTRGALDRAADTDSEFATIVDELVVYD